MPDQPDGEITSLPGGIRKGEPEAEARLTDVRVIAATNRDLKAAIESGKFRSDLFYRLNVFPIEVPTLRERKEDIPLLLQYFLDRYGTKAGKSFRSVDKRSLDLLESYPWPGKLLREHQEQLREWAEINPPTFADKHVLVLAEIARIEKRDFDALRLYEQAIHLARENGFVQNEGLAHELAAQYCLAQEKAAIEAALRECGGRVYGPSGAAAKLGIPRSTLETKIRALKINKHRFKADLSTET